MEENKSYLIWSEENLSRWRRAQHLQYTGSAASCYKATPINSWIIVLSCSRMKMCRGSPTSMPQWYCRPHSIINVIFWRFCSNKVRSEPQQVKQTSLIWYQIWGICNFWNFDWTGEPTLRRTTHEKQSGQREPLFFICGDREMEIQESDRTNSSDVVEGRDV